MEHDRYSLSRQVVFVGPFDDLAEAVRQSGIEAIAIQDYDEALHQIRSGEHARLFVLQFFIAGGAGLDLVPEIRRSQAGAEIWISTAYSPDEIDDKWKKMGLCDRFVTYPPTTEMIVEVLLSR